MKLLTRLIHAMEKEDLRNFRLFAERIRSDQYDKKLLDLFDSIRDGELEDAPELRDALYPDGNKNAFYRLKNRLLTDIQRSLLVLHHELDPQTRVMKFLMMARWCQYRGEWEGARMLLEKAAKICETERIARWHTIVYEELLALSREDITLDPVPIVEELRRLDQEYAGFKEFAQALAIVSHQLRRTNLELPNESVLDRLSEIRTQLDALPRSEHPDQQWQLHQVVRDILLEKKEYEALETYLVESLAELEASGACTKAYLREKIVLLSWIVNTCSQNRRFGASLQWAEKLREALEEQGNRYFQTFIWTYYQALVVNFTCLGQLDQAIEHLESIRGGGVAYFPKQYEAYLSMNLFRLYHFQGNIKAAIQVLNDFLQSDDSKSLSDEILLSAWVSDIILRIENKDWEFATYRYKETRRKFRPLLELPEMAPHLDMLLVLRSWIKTGERKMTEKTRESALIYLQENHPVRIGDFINYKGWLFAEVQEENYYEVVQSWMTDPPESFEELAS